MPDKMRLDKFICSQRADLSRSDVKLLCRKGRICVNGEVIKSSDFKVSPDIDTISVDGVETSYKKYIYIMLNKPQGVVCSTRDGLSPTVLSLVPPELQRKGLFPAGRLDKDTEGFVLITDDGGLAHRMLSPKSHVPKKYYVELEHPYEDSYADAFRHGITLKTGEQCKPAEFIPCKDKENCCHVVLCEGMFHQVKKMFEALGNNVIYLKRIQIGGLHLDEKLPLGECLEILHKDVDKLTQHFVS